MRSPLQISPPFVAARGRGCLKSPVGISDSMATHKNSFGILAGSLLVLGVLTALDLRSASRPSLKAVCDGLVCQCGGCNFSVSTCNHEQCSSRDEMRAMAQKEIEAGKDETSILQDFVLRYGVKVLSTPPPGGFNSTVWILPGFAAVVGLAAAIMLVRRWRKRPTVGPPSARHDASNIDPQVLAAVEEERRKAGGRD
jgi:cytochrome c-type biogenesis protein CcmH/NrfF